MLNSVYDDRPADYDELRACWLNERRVAFTRTWLRGIKPQDHGLSVLELGSGTGWLLRELSTEFEDCTFLGLDPIDSYVDFSVAQTTAANVSYRVGTAETADFPEDSTPFDVILTNDMLHHVDSIPDVFTNIRRRVRPGTQWLLIEPNCGNPYTFLRQATLAGERNFWPRSFLNTAREAGWVLRRRDYLFLIPPFIRRPPTFAKVFERWLEHVPVLAGGIAIVIEKTDDSSS